MKTIIIWDDKINLVSEIKMKHMKKLMPIFNNMDWNEIENTAKMAEVLFIDLNWNNDLNKFKDFMDELTIPDMTTFFEWVWKIVDEWSKKKGAKK